MIARYKTLIDAEVKADTKKLGSYDAFLKATSPEEVTQEQDPETPRVGPLVEMAVCR